MLRGALGPGLRLVLVCFTLAAAPLSQAISQTSQSGLTGVLTIDPERVFEETAFGRRIIAETEKRAEALQAENRRIEGELTVEERELTELRPKLPVGEFRNLADAFDEKVDRIRAEQDGKAREIQERQETGRQDFVTRIGPALLAIVRDRRAAVLLDRRTVFLSAESVDITDEAIARIDRDIGTGEAPEAAQESAPE